MVATAILAFGLVPIFQALFISLDTFSLYANSLNAQIRMDEKIWEIKDELMRDETLRVGETRGRMNSPRKEFDWDMAIDVIDPEVNFYRLRLTYSWQEGKRKRQLSRAAYALAPLKEDNDKGTGSH